MSKPLKRWQLEEAPIGADDLAANIGVTPLLARLLIQRGYGSEDTARLFLNPDVNQTHSFNKLKGIEAAADVIVGAIRDEEKICVYGDYDVDGITAAALLSAALKDMGGKVYTFIPHRVRDGYGLNASVIRELHAKEYQLIVTVDNGISNVSEVELANSLGLRTVVVDHHQPGVELPAADAIVNPKQPGCEYPFKELAGVGVAYKVAQALLHRLGRDPSLANKYLDLAALGTIADIVPLRDENRVIVAAGLKLINESPSIGMKRLIEVSGLKSGTVTAGQVSFMLAPRLNAAGRMMSARDGFLLLTTNDEEEAERLARLLNQRNQERQRVEDKVLIDALRQVETYDPDSFQSIVLASSDWHDGVKGIVASRLVERYYRPTILFSERDGILKGSGRSIPGLDLYAALERCADSAINFGGHKAAAGVTVAVADFPAFRDRFETVIAEIMASEDLIKTIAIDTEISFNEIDDTLVTEIDRLAPFGAGNSAPKFLIRKVSLQDQQRLGRSGGLKMRVSSGEYAFPAVGFKLDDIDSLCDHKADVDLVYTLGRRSYRGEDFIQLRLVDVAIFDENLPKA